MANKRELIANGALSLVGCGYVMGATGWVCTQTRLKQQEVQYPEYAATIAKYGPKWLGKRCYDCAQLTRAAAAFAGYELVSGATSQWNQNIWAAKGTIDTLPKAEKAIFLFIQSAEDKRRMKHVAVVVDEDQEVDARGSAYGVIERAVSAGTYTHWARLRDLDETVPEVVTRPTLRKGDKGDDVVEAQHLLLEQGYSLPRYGADGSYGNESINAVKDFQRDHHLTADGVVGANTWAALLQTPAGVKAEPGDET